MQGSRIRKIREELGYTQEELAEKIGMAALQINRYENDKSEAKAETIAGIAHALNVSADYLLGLTDDPTPPNLANGLSTKERAAVTAWRRGDYKEAIKVIVGDE